MKISKRLALAPALAVAAAGLYAAPAHATTAPLAPDTVNAGVVAHCQADPANPLTLEQLAPTVVGQADVDVVPGELSAHLYSVLVDDGAGTTQHCTFGVLHRDTIPSSVKYEGSVHVELADANDPTTPRTADTPFSFGNLSRSSHWWNRYAPPQPTSVDVNGLLVPADSVATDPTYTVSVNRTHLETVSVDVPQYVKDAAQRYLDRATAQAAREYQHDVAVANRVAAHRGGAAKAQRMLAAAQRNYDRHLAAAQAVYQRAVAPKTVTKPVAEAFQVTGSVTASS